MLLGFLVAGCPSAPTPADPDPELDAGAGSVGVTLSFAGDASATATAIVELTIAVQGSTGGAARMRFSNDGAQWSEWEALAGTRAGWELGEPAVDGQKTVRVEVSEDSVTVGSGSASIALDTTPPAIAVFSVQDDAVAVSSPNVRLTVSASDATTEVALVEASNDGITFSPTGPELAWTLTSGDGEKTVTVRVTDLVGNSATAIDTVVIESTPPTLSGAAVNQGAAWTNLREVSVAPQGAADEIGGSGLAFLCVSGTAVAPSEQCQPFATAALFMLAPGDGPKSFEVFVRDVADNASTPVPVSIGLDQTPPVLETLVVKGGDAYATSLSVSVVATATDAASGVVSLSLTNDSAPFPTAIAWTSGQSRTHLLPDLDGLHTVRAVVFDRAGNMSVAMADEITLDRIPPTGTVVIGAGDPEFTRTLDVTLELTASPDTTEYCAKESSSSPTSGATCWKPISDPAFTLTSFEGLKAVYVWFRDGAGLRSPSSTQDSIRVDRTAPTLSITGAGRGLAGGAEAISQLLTSFTHVASDAQGLGMACVGEVSPPTNCAPWTDSPSVTLSTGDGMKTVYLQVTDLAGNSSAIVSDMIRLDQTRPTITALTINGGASFTQSAEVTVAVTAQDDQQLAFLELSDDGVTFTRRAFAPSVSYVLPSGDGPKFVTAQVVDLAGNVSAGPAPVATIRLDQDPPVARLDVLNGRTHFNTATVPLTIDVEEDPTGFSQAMFVQAATQAAPATPTAFVPFASPVQLDLTAAGEGPQRVYVWIRDAGGNVSVSPATYDLTYDTVAPTVFSHSPRDGATEIPTDARPQLIFSETIDPASFHAGNFTVSGATGTPTLDGFGHFAWFTPTAPLTTGSVVTVSLSNVRDLAGNTLATPLVFSFTVNDAVRLSGPTAPLARDLGIAQTGGRTLAYWNASSGFPSSGGWAERGLAGWSGDRLKDFPFEQVVGFQGRLFATFRPGFNAERFSELVNGRWRVRGDLVEPLRLVANPTGLLDLRFIYPGNVSVRLFDGVDWTAITQIGDGATYEQIAATGSTSGFAVLWSKNGFSSHAVATSVYTPQSGWVNQTIVAALASAAFDVRLGVHANGYVASWRQGGDLWASTYSNQAAAWSAPTNFGVASHSRLVCEQGSCALVRAHTAGVAARVFDGTSWSTPANSFDATGSLAATIKLEAASMPGGGVVIAWEEGNDIRSSVQGSEGWSAVTTMGGGAPDLPLKLSSVGGKDRDAVVTFLQGYDAFARTYVNGNWSSTAQLNNGVLSGYPRAGIVDGAPGVMFGQGSSIVWRQMSSAGALLAPSTLGALEGTGSASDVKMAFTSAGKGLAVWRQLEGFSPSIYASAFDGAAWGAPFLVSRFGLTYEVATNGTNFVIAYTTNLYDTGGARAFSVSWTPASGLGTPVAMQVDPSIVSQGGHFVASDGTGFVSLWYSSTQSITELMSATSADGNTWSAPALVSSPLTGGDLRFEGSAAGYVLLQRGNSANVRLLTGGTWSTPKNVTNNAHCIASAGPAAFAVLCRISTQVTAYTSQGGVWTSASFSGPGNAPITLAASATGFRLTYADRTRTWSAGTWSAEETVIDLSGLAMASDGSEYLLIGYVDSPFNYDDSLTIHRSVNGTFQAAGFVERDDGFARRPVLKYGGGAYHSAWEQSDFSSGAYVIRARRL